MGSKRRVTERMNTDYSFEVKSNTALAQSGGTTLRLNTLENTRKSLARVVRMYGRLEIPERYYKSLVYGLGVLITAYRAQYEYEDLRREIAEIRDLLREVEHAK